jgi:hypothetical protein
MQLSLQPAVFPEDDADSQMPTSNTGYNFTAHFQHFIYVFLVIKTKM